MTYPPEVYTVPAMDTIQGYTAASPPVLTRAFAKHYVEMVLVMLVGMGVLALPVLWASDALGVDRDGTAGMLVRMGISMTIPMVPWMLWRGHGRRPALEMAGAMLVPAAGAVALYAAGVSGDVGVLMTIEHVAMFAAMFAVMAARPEEYSGHHRH